MHARYPILGFVAAVWVLTVVASFFFGLEKGRTRPIPTRVAAAPEPSGLVPAPSRGSGSSDTVDWSAGFRSASAQADRPARTSGRAVPSAGPQDSSWSLAGLSAALATTDPAQRAAAVANAAARIPTSALPGAVETLMIWPAGPDRRRALAAVAHRWGQVDPLAALTFAGEEPAPAIRQMLQQEVVQGWAAARPEEALAYVSENPDGLAPDQGVRAVFRSVSEMPMDRAVGFLAELDTAAYAGQVNQVLQALYNRSPADLVGWAESLPEGDLRNQAALGTVNAWSRYDPAAALAWMEDQKLDDPGLRHRAHRELAQNWGRLDPEAGVDWYDGLPEDARSPEVLERLFSSWLRYEPTGAAAWLGERQPDASLDPTIRDYIRYIERVDPGAALAWAETLNDPRMLAQEAMRTGQAWLRRDPQAALRHLSESTIEFRGREQLLQEAQRRAKKGR